MSLIPAESLQEKLSENKKENQIATEAPLSEYPYESPTFLEAWWSNLAGRFDIPFKNHDLLVHRKRLLKGLFTFREARIAGWNSAWSQDFTPARLAELQSLGRSANWDYCRLNWNESREALQARDALAQSGLPSLEMPGQTQYLIDLSKGFEAYLMSLSANGRKGLKKKMRKAEALQPQRIVLSEEADIVPFFQELFPLHQAHWDEKAGGSYYNIPAERDFIMNWSLALHRRGQLVLDKIMLGGETVNLGMGIRIGDEFYWLLTINTGKQLDAGPGLIGLYLRAEALAQEGVTCFKMGAGDYFYKVQSANAQETTRELIIANPASLRGRLYLAWLKRQQAKKKTSDSTQAEF
jgi:CelD/BcsL family acetyltransferase involved in cellulose biosynthesis